MILDALSDYSLLQSLLKPKDLAEYAKKQGWKFLGTADYNAGGLLDIYLACKSQGIKCLLGLRFVVTTEIGKKGQDQIILYAQNLEGYHELIKLFSKSAIEGQNNLWTGWLKDVKNLLCVLPIGSSPNEAKNEDGDKIIAEIREIFKGKLFFGLYDRDASIDDIWLNKAKETGIPYLFLSGARYFKTEDMEAYRVLRAISEKNTLEGLFESVWLDESIESSEKKMLTFEHQSYLDKFVGMIDIQIDTPGLKVPKFSFPDKYKSSYDYLVDICREGLKVKKAEFEGKEKLEAVRIRMKTELDVVKRCELADYFLLVYDICQYCDKNDIARGIGRGCLTSDSFIKTDESLKKISDVLIGDKVISDDGTFRKIVNKFEYNISEEVISFKHRYSNFFDNPSYTLDHKILVVKNEKLGKNKQRRIYKIPLFIQRQYYKTDMRPEYIEAKRIECGDFLCIPITKEDEENIDVFDLSEFITDKIKCKYDEEYLYIDTPTNKSNKIFIRTNSRKLGIDKTTLGRIVFGVMKNSCYLGKIQKRCIELGFASLSEWGKAIHIKKNISDKVTRKIPCDYNFLKILGLFISDGWIAHRGAAIGFGFHSINNKKQISFVSQFFKKLGCRIYLNKSKKRKLIQVYVNSRLIANFFNYLVDKYAINKNIHPSIKKLPIQKLKGLVEGLLLGDGHIKSKVNDKSSYDSINLNLILDLKEILIRFGIPSSVLMRRADIKKSRPNDCYKLEIATNDSFGIAKNYFFYKNEKYIFIPVLKRATKIYNGKVYDLEVEGNPSFRTSNYIVHNSASGSLISYLMGITHVNPLQYNLLFERFLNEDRVLPIMHKGEQYLTDAPDIDLDVSQLQRQQIIEWLQQKYGSVARISTYTTLTGKAAVKDCMRAFGCLEKDAHQIASCIEILFGKSDSIEETYKKSSNFKRWADNNSRIYSVIKKLENIRKNSSVHAAGLVISSNNVANRAPLFLSHTTGDEYKQAECIAFDLNHAAKAGLLKVDILGLRTLSMLHETIKLIKCSN